MLVANLVLEFTVERIFVGDAYGDVPLGLYLVRGENVVLVGQIVSHFSIISESVSSLLCAGRNDLSNLGIY